MRANLDFRFRHDIPEPLLVIPWIAASAVVAAVDVLTCGISVFFLSVLLVAPVSLTLGVWNGGERVRSQRDDSVLRADRLPYRAKRTGKGCFDMKPPAVARPDRTPCAAA